MPDTILPYKVTDLSVVCPNPSSGSLGSKGVYTVISELDQNNQFTGRAFKLQAFRNYLQQNVSDKTKPNGHPYTEWGIRTDLTWNPPHVKIAQDTGRILMPFPCISTWWRAMDLNEDERKMSTRYYEVGYADTGQDAIFQQNVC